MKQAFAKAQIEAEMKSRFGAVFKLGDKFSAYFLSSGMSEVDALTSGGLPRGAITEIIGGSSSGRTSLLLSALAYATSNNETCALVDTSDTFDPASAANARVDFDRLLWVRCGHSVEHAFKATDLLLQSGGFGLVALNLADVAAKYTRRIISSWWFRFRRAIESTPTALAVVTPVACVRSCAAVVLEMKNEGAVWPGTGTTREETEQSTNKSHQLSLVADSVRQVKHQPSLLTHSQLLCGIDVRINREKPASWTGGPARFSPRVCT
jgi:hypothetical protein